jgi:hypothetical protein
VTTLDLRREARRDPVRVPDVGGLAPEEREQVIQSWRSRMVSEHASARVFAALVPQLMRAGAARSHIAQVSAMVGQELEHGLLCARVLAGFGEEAAAPMRDLPDVPLHEDATPLEAVLRNVISISCASETVAVALVADEHEIAGSPDLARVLRTILADEVKHSRFGWRLLKDAAPELGADERERLDAYLVDMFEHQIDFHAGFLRMPNASERAAAVGAPRGEAGFRTFVDVIEQVTVPGLERHGFAARAAWSQAIARMAH